MDTFQQPITFLAKVFNEDPAVNKWETKEITKIATFRDLDERDKDQHKLHFKILSVVDLGGIGDNDGDAKVRIDSDALYDLTVKAINQLLVPDETFTIQDKKEFLSDSGAIFNFGMWLLTNKFLPFFSRFTRKLKA